MADQAVTGPLIDPVELEAIVVEILDALVVNAGIDLQASFPAEPGIEATPVSAEIVIHADAEVSVVVGLN